MLLILELKGAALRAALGLVLLLAACGSSVPGNAERQAADGPTASEAEMHAALHCPVAFTSSSNPVLLVHGTGANAEVAWNFGLLPILRRHGYDACTIDLPDYAWGDIQASAEYVVYAVRRIAQLSGKHLALIGHSQGVLEINWAIKRWPDVATLVDESIGLAGIYHGVDVDSNICSLHLCPPAGYQMDRTSNLLAAMLRGGETPGHADYTSIYSMNDGAARYPSPVLQGARNIAVQSVCPGREVSHPHMVLDAVAVALVLDALDHPGPADPARIDRAVCKRDVADGIDTQQVHSREIHGGLVCLRTILDAGLTRREPALKRD